MTPTRAILAGTVAVGVLDLLDAFIFFGLRSGVPPVRILQSIAAGLLGRDAFSGGASAAALGFALHFFIAFVIVLVFFVASRWLPALTRHVVASGIAYGLVVYAVMNYVVLPLSNAGRGAFVLPVFVNGVLIHMAGVGLPAAFAARAARSPVPTRQ